MTIDIIKITYYLTHRLNEYFHTKLQNAVSHCKHIFVCFDEIAQKDYNYGHNIMSIFDVLPNFPFTTIERKPDY